MSKIPKDRWKQLEEDFSKFRADSKAEADGLRREIDVLKSRIDDLHPRRNTILAAVSIALTILNFGVAFLAYNFSVSSFNIVNNYPPTVSVTDVSTLWLSESCARDITNPMVKDCLLSGTFNATILIVSAHNGFYDVGVESFKADPSSQYWVQGFSLGKNLTVINFLFTNGSYLIKAFNNTSSHYAYFVGLGNFTFPTAYTIKDEFSISSESEGIIATGSQRQPLTFQLRSEITRPWNFTSTKQQVPFGVLTMVFTLHDRQTGVDYPTTFTVPVYLVD